MIICKRSPIPEGDDLPKELQEVARTIPIVARIGRRRDASVTMLKKMSQYMPDLK